LKKHIVRLTADERARLEALTRKGTARARQLKRALILLAADEGEKDEMIAARVRVHLNTVVRIRHRFAEEGLEKALSERPRPGNPRKLAGRQEAYLIALACSDPPEGRDKWTMQLLANRLIELNVLEAISKDTVWRTLKRGTLNLGNAESGALPQ
jgi:transposase